MNNVDQLFTKMELQGVNTKEPLLYGYFFFGKNEAVLYPVKSELIKKGYAFVELFKAEDGEFVLHVEKTERHSRQTLARLDNEMREFASHFKKVEYDGWDVGNSDQKKALVTNEGFLAYLKSKPDSEIFSHAISLYENDIYDRAIEAFDICIEKGINPDTALFKSGNCLVSLKKPLDGIERFKKALIINPHYYSACYNIAAISYEIKNMAQCEEYYKKCLELSKTDDRAYYGLAAVQFSLNNLSESALNCKITLSLNSKNENALVLQKMLKKKGIKIL